MTGSDSPAPSHRASLGDSPWYWLFLFSVVSFVALLAMGPRYARRQAIVEQKYEAHQASKPRRDQAASNERSLKDRATASPDEPVYDAAQRRLLISLAPLTWIAGVASALTAYLFWRNELRFRRRGNEP